VNQWGGSVCVLQGNDTIVLEEHADSIYRFVLISQAARCHDSEDHSSNLHHEIFERNAYSEVPDCEGVMTVWMLSFDIGEKKSEMSSVVLCCNMNIKTKKPTRVVLILHLRFNTAPELDGFCGDCEGKTIAA
jgi:hypothetical protein